MTDAEIKVMRLLWKYSDLSAKNLAAMLYESVGWKKNTTYTVIKTCINKGYIKRLEPHFICRPIIKESEAQKRALNDIKLKYFDGSPNLLFTMVAANHIGEAQNSKRAVKDLISLLEKMYVN